jgi:hypothetical protein
VRATGNAYTVVANKCEQQVHLARRIDKIIADDRKDTAGQAVKVGKQEAFLMGPVAAGNWRQIELSVEPARKPRSRTEATDCEQLLRAEAIPRRVAGSIPAARPSPETGRGSFDQAMAKSWLPGLHGPDLHSTWQ